MPFESISHTHEFSASDFSDRWIPLTHLYDADLPLFPLLYFHVLDPRIPPSVRPGETDRAFGFVHKLSWGASGLSITLACNKRLGDVSNNSLKEAVENDVRGRLGLGSPVELSDINNMLVDKLSDGNALFREIWYKIADRAYGKRLPFGRMWDGTLGLIRFIASWFSEGRNGELIQTHYFASDFGERISTSADFNADFYLLPTYAELRDASNPLSLFPRFKLIVDAAIHFTTKYCDTRSVSANNKFSGFQLSRVGGGKKLSTDHIMKIIGEAPLRLQDVMYRCYGAFNRGPQRSIIAFMMISDLRTGKWNPENISIEECALIYTALKRSYQSPKVIHLYTQQCFGNEHVLPIDIWVETFLEHPFRFRPSSLKTYHEELFKCSNKWGKIERLIWLASQGRKVHSSVCSDILWCIRFGGPDKQMRGANPLSCKICREVVRDACPAYAAIKDKYVSFNGDKSGGVLPEFNISTEKGNNHDPSQRIIKAEGDNSFDEYSVRDCPDSFPKYPISGHDGTPLMVRDFINQYN